MIWYALHEKMILAFQNETRLILEDKAWEDEGKVPGIGNELQAHPKSHQPFHVVMILLFYVQISCKNHLQNY